MKFLVDPTKITKFDCDHAELELLILFWICAAGKNALTSARGLNQLLSDNDTGGTPFQIIRDIKNLENAMQLAGIGCFRRKALYFKDLISKKLDLKTCGVEALESVKGIGPKTARCFLMHSRRNQPYAGLDRHILNYLRDLGYSVPKSTPTKKQYKAVESIFLNVAAQAGKTVEQLDLEVWKKYSGRD